MIAWLVRLVNVFRCCGSYHDGYLCNLSRGHEGQHVAYAEPTRPVARWD